MRTIRPVLFSLLLAVAATAASGARTACAQPDDGVRSRVPEAADYVLVYDLKVPRTASFNTEAVPYTVDRSAELDGTFDRVAYYLELTTLDGDTRWAYASMRAFTADLSLIDVPSRTPVRSGSATSTT